jgi:hypothetical protein
MDSASVKKLEGLTRPLEFGKRPDGWTLIPWREGRSATCDVTNTAPDSYLAMHGNHQPSRSVKIEFQIRDAKAHH